MHSRPDRLTNNCLDIALPFLAFPYLATAPIYGHLPSSSQIDSLQTISPLIACKGLHESHAIT
jgi:hypothetical protein